VAHITISPKFIAQLKEICEYLGENRSAEFANEFVDKVFDEIAQLERFPKLWQQIDIPHVEGEFRRILQGVHQIFYENADEHIIVHSIFDGRRRPPLFRPD